MAGSTQSGRAMPTASMVPLASAVHAGGGAEAARHHQRHFHRGADVLCVFEEIGFAGDGASGALGLLGMQGQIVEADKARLLIGAAGDFEEIEPSASSQAATRIASLWEKPPRWKSAEFSFTETGSRGRPPCAPRGRFRAEAARFFEAAAPFVGAAVDVGREELRNQIAMRAMNLDAGKPVSRATAAT